MRKKKDIGADSWFCKLSNHVTEHIRSTKYRIVWDQVRRYYTNLVIVQNPPDPSLTIMQDQDWVWK